MGRFLDSANALTVPCETLKISDASDTLTHSLSPAFINESPLALAGPPNQ